MAAYATLEQVQALYRDLSLAERERVIALLPVVSDLLRYEASKVGKDLDAMIDSGKISETVVMSVTVDVIIRILNQGTDGPSVSQESQSALGYTATQTYYNPSSGIAGAILHNDLDRLGLNCMRIGYIYAEGDGNEY